MSFLFYHQIMIDLNNPKKKDSFGEVSLDKDHKKGNIFCSVENSSCKNCDDFKKNEEKDLKISNDDKKQSKSDTSNNLEIQSPLDKKELSSPLNIPELTSPLDELELPSTPVQSEISVQEQDTEKNKKNNPFEFFKKIFQK